MGLQTDVVRNVEPSSNGGVRILGMGQQAISETSVTLPVGTVSFPEAFLSVEIVDYVARGSVRSSYDYNM